MNEKPIEKYLVKKAKSIGARAAKFVSPGWSGVPDRIIMAPGGLIVFVECKAPGEKPRKLQVYRMKQLNELGFRTETVDTYESVDRLINDIDRDVYFLNSLTPEEEDPYHDF